MVRNPEPRFGRVLDSTGVAAVDMPGHLSTAAFLSRSHHAAGVWELPHLDTPSHLFAGILFASLQADPRVGSEEAQIARADHDGSPSQQPEAEHAGSCERGRTLQGVVVPLVDAAAGEAGGHGIGDEDGRVPRQARGRRDGRKPCRRRCSPRRRGDAQDAADEALPSCREMESLL